MLEAARTIAVGMTGASGSVYGLDLLRRLEKEPAVTRVFLVVSPSGLQVSRHELGIDLNELSSLGLSKVEVLSSDDLFAPIASGSFPLSGMAVLPCSMGTVGALASAAPRNLLHRAADVCLKERRPLVLVPRETPLGVLHLENLLRLARAGATILPAMPAFYHHPDSLEALVSTVTWRVMQHLGLPVPASSQWKGE